MCESDNGFLTLAQDRPLAARGFTLIELLIAMVLLALLIAIALASMGRARDQVYVAAVQTDLRNLVTAQEDFFAASDELADGPRYSESLEELDFRPSRGVEMQITLEGAGLDCSRPAHQPKNSPLRGIRGGSGGLLAG